MAGTARSAKTSKQAESWLRWQGFLGNLRERPFSAGVVLLACLAIIAATGYFLIWPHLRGWYHWRQMAAAARDSDFENARLHLQECLKIWPNSPEVHFHLARVARRDGDYATARQELVIAQRLGWPESAIELEKQLIQAQSGAIREVQEALKSRVETGHEDSELILEALTTGYLQNNFLADAFVTALYWQKLFPNRWQSHLLLGILFERRHRADLATAEYRRVLELKPDQIQARHQLAFLLVSYSKLYPEALEQYREIVRYHPDDLAGWVGMARCLRALQRYDEARKSLDEVFRRDPEYPDAWLLRAQLARDEEKLEEALEWARKAYEKMPHDLSANHILASVLFELGRNEEAEPYNRRRLELERDIRRLMEIRRSIYDLEHEKSKNLESLGSQRSKTLALRREAANLALRLGDETDAALWTLSLLQLDPTDPEARRLAAELQARRQGKGETRQPKAFTPQTLPGLGEPYRPERSGR
ncbi:MAG: tetratricopeptide repeat protein [Gemmatales bacterium]|nr:tetratricopeptide repeat protein [Gemmatales bacterium]MDW8386800.1 tetratricopeptide repeat protein [Gemmatales bacterium]